MKKREGRWTDTTDKESEPFTDTTMLGKDISNQLVFDQRPV